jgi:hypothetical protein
VLKRLSYFLLCAAGILLQVSTTALAQQPDSAARSVPSNALLYASVDIPAIQQFSDQFRNSALHQALTAGRTRRQQGSAPRAWQLLGMLNQSISGRIGIALADEDVHPGKSPSLVAILPVRSKEQAQTLLFLLQSMTPDSRNTQTDEYYQGVTITTISGGLLEGAPLRFAALSDCLLVGVGADIHWLQKAIDANAGRGDSLAADSKFMALQARVVGMGPNAAWVWMNMQRMQERILDITTRSGTPASAPGARGKATAKPAPALDPQALKAFFAAYKGGAFRLLLSSTSATVEGLILVNGENEIGRKILGRRSSPLHAASVASADAILFISGSSIFPTLDDIHHELSPDANARTLMEGLVDTVQKTLGLNLEEDIFANLGPEVALALNEFPSNPTATPPLLIYVQTRDKKAMEETLEKLRRNVAERMNLQFVQKDLPQGRIYYLDPSKNRSPVFPGWAFAGDFLVIGTTPDALKTPIYLASGQGGSPLASSPAYQEAVAGAGDHLAGVFLLNTQKIAALMDRIQMLQHAAKAAQSVSDTSAGGSKSLDMADMQHIFQALQGLSAISTVEEDAITMRMTLSFDLNK